MTAEIGKTAPAFSLVRRPGSEPVELSSFRGTRNVVLLFFPLAWSPVCTQELCRVRDDYSQFAELDAEVLGISVDSPFVLSRWAEEQGFPFPLLSDFNRETSRAYDAIYESFFGLHGVAKRAAFVIDKEGILRYAEVLEDAGRQPSFEAVRDTLAALS